MMMLPALAVAACGSSTSTTPTSAGTSTGGASGAASLATKSIPSLGTDAGNDAWPSAEQQRRSVVRDQLVRHGDQEARLRRRQHQRLLADRPSRPCSVVTLQGQGPPAATVALR